MNRLKGQRFYLSGPMEHVSRQEAVGWRQHMTQFLTNLGAIVVDPCDKPIDKFKEDVEMAAQIKNFKETDQFDKVAAIMKPIRNIDLRCVDISDALIVHYDPDAHMVGTLEELFVANRSKKPVIVCCPKGKSKVSSWIYGTLPDQLIFDTWTGVEKYLGHIHASDDIDHLKRWWFFSL